MKYWHTRNVPKLKKLYANDGFLLEGVGVSYPFTGLDRLLGFHEVQVP
jgi:hypothetical protein